MSLQLGPFTIDHPFILAPMAGITNSPYRRLMRRMKSAVVVSELVSANGIEYAGEKTMNMLKFHEEERIVGLQIFGEDTDHLCRAAQVVEKLGADFVDLNLGCPVPKITKKGAGSAMCRNPVELGRVLEKMVRAIRIPLTIKIRTGWDSESRNAHEVVKVAADAGVKWVAIHGRTRAQGYAGKADWDYIAEVKAKSPLPIIGNGDITTAQQAVDRYRSSGVDAVLIGRAALRNPFLFEQAQALLSGQEIPPVTQERYLALLDTQRVLLSESFAPHGALLHARKFLAWYASGFPGCHEFRKKVFAIEETDLLWNEARAFFSRSTDNRDFQFLAEPFLMGGHG